MGWLRVCQVLFANYGCSTSRSHATYTRIPDYATVPEEAAGLLDHAECHQAHLATTWYHYTTYAGDRHTGR
jgi:hypothetical protein